jgi:hypothetical protein
MVPSSPLEPPVEHGRQAPQRPRLSLSASTSTGPAFRGRGGRLGPVAHVLCPVVVGRDEELRILESCLGAAQSGRGGCAVLTGEPGIGKSRLARELMRLAAGRGATVVAGRAVPAGASAPYRPLTEASSSSGVQSPVDQPAVPRVLRSIHDDQHRRPGTGCDRRLDLERRDGVRGKVAGSKDRAANDLAAGRSVSSVHAASGERRSSPTGGAHSAGLATRWRLACL